MSTATPIFGFRYPLGADSVNVPGDLKNLADDVEATLADAWTSYTPTFSGSGTPPAIGNGTIVGAYKKWGKTVLFRIEITMGSTSSYGNGNWTLTLPTAPLTTARHIYQGIVRDTSATATYPLWGEFVSPTLQLRQLSTTAGNNFRDVTATVPFTWATGDMVAIQGTYEAA